MTLWLYFSLLAGGAVFFVLWRLARRSSESAVDMGDDLELNRHLLVEKINQLELQLEQGEISRQQFHDLQLEHQRQFLVDNPQLSASAGSATAVGGQCSGGALVIASAVVVPLLAMVIYFQLGASQELKLRELLKERSQLLMSESPDLMQLRSVTDQVLKGLSQSSQRHAEDPLYPVLLARLYMDDGAYALAKNQYQRATALLPEDGDMRAEYAQALFFAAGNQVNDEVVREADLALRLSPNNQTALGLMGIASFQGGQFQQAIDYWNRALALLPSASPSRNALLSGIAAARERIGADAEAQNARQDSDQAPASLTVNVALSTNIEAPPNATVYVYARAWQGSPMPLAIKKMKFSDFPTQVVLDETMAMNPQMGLSSVPEVEVVARVSLSGQPTPAAGDYEGTLGPVATAKQPDPLNLTIDRLLD
jgi:cytochrome c-type biogenesis protein CcmH